MFSYKDILLKIQQIQPVSITGIVSHSLLWLFSPNDDVIYFNPHFQVSAPLNEELPKGIAIYCIHGTADRASAFSLIADKLINQLPDLISSIHLVSFNKRAAGMGIEFFAEQLAGKIIANGHKNIIVIGHSRGGLVASYFAEYLAETKDINVEAIIAIATPFGGSDLAQWPLSWFSNSIHQMEVNSEFLQNLSLKITQSQKKYFYFAAENDALVSLEASCVKDQQNSPMIFDRHGHLSIMSSPRLVECLQDCIFQILDSLTPLIKTEEQKKQLPTTLFTDLGITDQEDEKKEQIDGIRTRI